MVEHRSLEREGDGGRQKCRERGRGWKTGG